jgi:hypothetical protein
MEQRITAVARVGHEREGGIVPEDSKELGIIDVERAGFEGFGGRTGRDEQLQLLARLWDKGRRRGRWDVKG